MEEIVKRLSAISLLVDKIGVIINADDEAVAISMMFDYYPKLVELVDEALRKAEQKQVDIALKKREQNNT